jgi:proteasome accessory factor A
MAMFERLAGLETEYALRFSGGTADGARVPNTTLFDGLRNHVAARVPLVQAIVRENGWFLANGGGLKLERLPLYTVPTAGLVEGATPECRGPGQLLLYQRAQDALLSRAAAASSGGEALLLKNNHDGNGHYFGCHENYEAAVASGRRLLLWRIGLGLALPVIFLLLVVGDLAACILSAVPMVLLLRRRRGEWLWTGLIRWSLFLSRLPAQLATQALLGPIAFVELRRQLLPFLISRSVIAGTGMIGADGRFTLSPRARVVRSVCGLSASAWRSVFYFCHVIKATVEFVSGDPAPVARLFRERQRLQITVGDSNMAQFAEYLKVGTTLLVLDAIEAGELAGAPRLRRPLKALRTICADPDLRATVPLGGGRRWTALQIQRFYLAACRRCVERTRPDHTEARLVLRLWQETLDALEEEPARLVGKLDWVTKKHLLDCAGPDASPAARSKIDLRYHELGRDGYYLRLEAAGLAPTLVEPEQVLQAITVPPTGTPATRRGKLIRTHAPSDVMRASWSSVLLPSGQRLSL